VLETVEAFSDIGEYGTAWDYLTMTCNTEELRRWRRLGPESARYLPDATSLQSVALMRSTFGDTPRLRLKVQANLTRLVHGADGKAWTLHDEEVPVGCLLMLGEAQKALQGASGAFADWRLSRVDASVTVGLQSEDVNLAFPAWAAGFWALHGGRRQTSQPGPHSLAHQRTQECKVRMYDKSAETLARTGKTPEGPHLVRLEEQTMGRTVRAAYGETLAELVEGGAVVAKTRLAEWVDRIPAAVASDGDALFARLHLSGMSAERATSLVHAAQVLRSAGVEGLMSRGISRATAYRWATEIRNALGAQGLDGESYGVGFDLDDAVFARDMAGPR
jgi:hypothetical protein